MSGSTTDTAYRIVGSVTRSHGLKGALKVRPETDDPYRFDDLTTVFLGKEESDLLPFSVESVQYQPMKSGVAVLLQLKEVTTRDEADARVGSLVWALEADLPPLEDGEVYLSDLVGLHVHSEEGRLLGEVLDVIELPAHPTLSVRKVDGSQALVPFVPALVTQVDLETRSLTVASIEGLLEGDALSERD